MDMNILKEEFLSCFGKKVQKTCGIEFNLEKFQNICNKYQIKLNYSFNYILFKKENYENNLDCFKNSNYLIMEIIKEEIINDLNDFLNRYSDVNQNILQLRSENIGKIVKIRFLNEFFKGIDKKDLREGEIVNINKSNDQHLYPYNSFYYHIKLDNDVIWRCGNSSLQPEVLTF